MLPTTCAVAHDTRLLHTDAGWIWQSWQGSSTRNINGSSARVHPAARCVGLHWCQLDSVSRMFVRRLGCFRMDAAMMADRLRTLSRQGCTSEVLGLLQDFGKRCTGIHATAMPLELHNRSMYVGSSCRVLGFCATLSR